ncbi:hypothetical protein [Domibacillus epiphyticus]|uniref:Uncharacterized protein n=1 Tax=Domibacillus epiphyticus TaxID=1714355 RepID=A0A1V2A5C7_9BACI|nr:hypothetical protein [Domibacillus epiphyticus]OMP66176.1 hypothetical protein BTO28_13730 [Domibacillus epiphyticus]
MDKQLFIGGVAAMLSLGLTGCGDGGEQNNGGNNGQKEIQQNNHSDINEGTDENNDTGINKDEQIELEPNDSDENDEGNGN